MTLSTLTAQQADGLACVVCEGEAPTIPVGWSETGSQVFACAGCCGEVDE
jgi:hypothetical protein